MNSDRNVKLADFGMTRPIMNSEFYRFSRKGEELEELVDLSSGG